MSDQTEKQARNQLAEAYRRVVDLGLTELSSGNLSVRFGNGMLISPAGADGDNICEESIVYVNASGDWDKSLDPSSEWQLHAGIYRNDVNTTAIVHTHSDNCVAVSCHCHSLPPFHYLVGLFGGDDVPCVPYSTFGSETLAQDVSHALIDRYACLMANHGMTARGPSMPIAMMFAHRLEILCRQYLLAQQLGEPNHLSVEDMDAFREKISKISYGR
ncbi:MULTISPECIES: class II aldolase/adducin family protein [unclassified Novosphingobium]|uniref:class II aldolase/adducin family protein n=1 Tax=unclassified Novosphingobium TaxID=2644732 RepID=UPI0003B47E4A|nr:MULTISPECIES: class II aldolase/adducin family protein [unclassified Novosphingobium]PTR07736.1 L-fuculose-phosphate aldolase [Novosphingobium sp. GV055]PUB00422.1 L-fuculose-phosphate aldolase [Novosphingobium sp. GV061]PUB15761.1 L-fuculose-phosphate aldolase [Novosphingobium sp. GV079]PUB39448.1 L-fuculose-phosphate aldolase [Novosphingobium sp. GV027]